MAKSPEVVAEFLTSLAKKLQPLKAEERTLFLQYKAEEVKEVVFLHISNEMHFFFRNVLALKCH